MRIIYTGKCEGSPDRACPCFGSGLDGTSSALVAHIICVRPGSTSCWAFAKGNLDRRQGLARKLAGSRARRRNRGTLPPGARSQTSSPCGVSEPAIWPVALHDLGLGAPRSHCDHFHEAAHGFVAVHFGAWLKRARAGAILWGCGSPTADAHAGPEGSADEFSRRASPTPRYVRAQQ